MARKRADTVQVSAVSYETLALDTPLNFPPPLAELAPNPDGFEFFWRLLTYAFRLSDPSGFPALPTAPPDEDAADDGLLTQLRRGGRRQDPALRRSQL